MTTRRPTTRRPTARRRAAPDDRLTPRKKRRVLRFCTRLALVVLPILFLVALGLGAAYVKMANGPVSLTFLKSSIEQRIAAKLNGLNVAVRDVVFSIDDHGMELRLEDVEVTDHDNVPVARAPYAAVEIDKVALLTGQISLNGITLIRPRLHVAYSRDNGLMLSFAGARPVAGAGRLATSTAPIGPDAAVSGPRGDAIAPAPSVATGGAPELDPARAQASARTTAPVPPRNTVFELLAGYMNEVAANGAADNGLDRMGVRNALIVFEHQGRRSIWGIPSGDIDIKHSGTAVLVSGLANIADSNGTNSVLSFTAETPRERRDVALTGAIRDFRPAMLAGAAEGLDGISALDVALSAEGRVRLSGDGRILDGQVALEVQRGKLALPPELELAPVAIDHGRIALRFGKAHDDLEIAPSAIAWGGGNELRFNGRVRAPAASDGAWGLTLTGLDGKLLQGSGAGVARKVDSWSARARIDAANGAFVLEEADVSVDGLRAVFSAAYESAAPPRARDTGRQSPAVRFEARIGAGPVTALPLIWPENIAVDARAWMQKHISGGRLTEGRIDYRWPETTPDSLPEGAPAEISMIILQGDGIALQGLGGGPVVAPKALLRLTGRHLEVAMPSAEMSIRGGKPLDLRRVSFDIADVWADRPAGRLSATLDGELAAVSRLLTGSGNVATILPERYAALIARATGRVSGKLEMGIPLTGKDTGQPRLTGELRITDTRLKDVIAGHDLTGGDFDIALDDKAVTVAAKLQIDGVAGRLDWQHIYDARPDQQPPLRLRANLDARDRDKLGLEVNHIMRGPLDVAAAFSERADGSLASSVHVDVKQTQIAVESLAWVKPAGRDTTIDFEIVPGDAGHLKLDNLRVAGDGVAISGHATLDGNNHLKGFALPNFSIDRVTRLAITGERGENKVWRVDVKGQTYEGRSLFRSLFNAGRVEGAPKRLDPDQPGVDLQADVKTVLGFWSSRLTDVRMSLSKRGGRLSAMQIEGRFPDGGRLKSALVRSDSGRRQLHAFSSDAGDAFRLVGFYPNTRRGRLELVVDLDGAGAAEKTGVLLVRDFEIVGDQVVREMAATSSAGGRRRGRQGADYAQAMSFDWMRLPFRVGNGQFVLSNAELRGPVVGATIEGRANFEAQKIDLTGTYVPLQGLNGALGVIPGLGQILAGPKGEGVLGIKFAVRGRMDKPEVLVNPLSLMAPGIFRELFQMPPPALDTAESGSGKQPAAKNGAGGRGWARRAFGESN